MFKLATDGPCIFLFIVLIDLLYPGRALTSLPY